MKWFNVLLVSGLVLVLVASMAQGAPVEFQQTGSNLTFGQLTSDGHLNDLMVGITHNTSHWITQQRGDGSNIILFNKTLNTTVGNHTSFFSVYNFGASTSSNGLIYLPEIDKFLIVYDSGSAPAVRVYNYSGTIMGSTALAGSDGYSRIGWNGTNVVIFRSGIGYFVSYAINNSYELVNYSAIAIPNLSIGALHNNDYGGNILWNNTNWIFTNRSHILATNHNFSIITYSYPLDTVSSYTGGITEDVYFYYLATFNSSIVNKLFKTTALNQQVTMYLKDVSNNATINNFNVTIDGTKYSTTTGNVTVNTTIDTAKYMYFETNGYEPLGVNEYIDVYTPYTGYVRKPDYIINITSPAPGDYVGTYLNLSFTDNITSNVNYYEVNITTSNGTEYVINASYILSPTTGSYNYNNIILYTKNLSIGAATIKIKGYYSDNLTQTDTQSVNINRNTYVNITALNSINNASLVRFNYTLLHSSGELINGSTSTSNMSVQWINGTTDATISGSNLVSKTESITAVIGTTNYYNISTYPGNVLILSAKDMYYNTFLVNVSVNLTGGTNYALMVNSTSIFQNITSGIYSVLVGKSGYTSFTDSLVSGSTILVNKTFFLSSSASTVTIYAKNIYDQYIVGANVTLSRASDGVLVGQKQTDGTGGAAFVLDTNLQYTLNISAANYNTYSGLLSVLSSTVVITLAQNTTNIPDFYAGITTQNSPNPGILLQSNTTYNFTSNFTSTNWNITACNISVYTLNNTLLNTTTYSICNPTNGTGNISYRTGNYSFLQIITMYTVNNSGSSQTISYKVRYGISNTYEGDFSIMHGLRSFSAFDKSGFGSGERLMIVFIVIFSVVIAAARRSVNKYVNSGTLLLLVALLTIAASAADLLHLDFIDPTTVTGPVMAQWGVAILIGILAGFTIFENARKGIEQ